MNSSKFKDQIEAWRRDLIDFSRRNNLLNVSTRATSVNVIEPGFNAVLEGLLSGRAWMLHLPAETEGAEAVDAGSSSTLRAVKEGPLLPNELRPEGKDRGKILASLRTLRRRAQQESIDKGLAVLYMTFGVLEWTDRTETWSSPLLLAPVCLEKLEGGGFSVQLNDEEDVVVNPSLQEKLRDVFDLGIEIAFDEDRPLGSFEQFKRLAKQHEGWEVKETIRLGASSFAKEVMYRDLGDNADRLAASELVKVLASGSESDGQFEFQVVDDDKLDATYPPGTLRSILDADSTQKKAIIAAREGRSFVIDGPPGSGKSQTIANIIAELMGQRKSVLFVSEKAAALEVVQKRLEGVGLGSFLLPLHSQKISRKEFASMLLRAANERTRVPDGMSKQEIARLTLTQTRLTAYVNAMNKKRDPLGRSLFDVLGEHALLANYPVAPLPTDVIDATLDEALVSDLLDSVERLTYVWDGVTNPSDVAWRGLNDPGKTNKLRPRIASDLDVFLSTAEEVRRRAQEVAADAGLLEPQRLKELRGLVGLGELTERTPPLPATWLAFESAEVLGVLLGNFSTRLLALRASASALSARAPRWNTLDEAIGSDVDRAAARLEELGNPPLRESLSVNEFLSQLGERIHSVDELERVLPLALELNERLGGGSHPLDIERIQTLCGAARLAAEAHRPESLWFTATGIQAARDVLDTLQPIVDDYWARAAALEEYFTPEIRQFPVDEFFQAGAVEPALSTFSSKGRANKKALAPYVKGGKISKEVSQRVAAVRELQALERQIQGDDRNSTALGTYYFKGVSTDFKSIAEAIESARKVIVSLGDADPEKLANALGRAALDAAEIAQRGERTADAVTKYIEATEAMSGEEPPFDQQIEATVVTSRQSLEVMTELSECLAAVQAASEGPLSIEEAFAIARERTEYVRLVEAFEGEQGTDEELLGDFYAGTSTDLESLAQALSWTSEALSALGGAPSRRVADRLIRVGVARDHELESGVDTLNRIEDELLSRFKADRAHELREDLELDLETAVGTMQTLVDQMDKIPEQVGFLEETTHLAELGLSDVVSFMLDQRMAADQLEPVARRAIYGAWIESILVDEKDALVPLEKKTRDAAVERFRELDEELTRHAVSEVVAIANDGRPKTNFGPMGLIRKEAAKSSRHMRIPQLIAGTKEIIQGIAPCFMMSPLSVSTYIPPEMVFDVVIFDEASQIMTSNAINCVYRARQLIVAGDEKQMPPSRGFEAALSGSDSDEFDEEEPEDFESLLHQANAGGFVTIGLRWHYRSRHESLITWSNVSFYDGSLVTYPSPSELSDQLGVSFVHVPDGVYERGGRRSNPIEARKVIERVFHHADHNPEMTLGVVAFSMAQADEIENALEDALKERPDLEDYFTTDRLDGFFVKNLENVQGDERDIVIFSVGYGKDEHGKLTMNFGPVNRDKGWRRLNVAFTRARCRVELVSSITAADFQLGGNESVNHLRRYFDYAERGIGALAFSSEHSLGDAESPFEEAVLQRIRSWGYDVDSQVGQAGYRMDMAVRDPKRPGAYVLGIECDGAMYHSSQVARDRDRLRQEVLEGLGWNLHRIWGPTWYRSRSAAEAALKEAIEKAIENHEATPGVVPRGSRERKVGERSLMPEAPVTAASHEVHEIELSDTPDWIVPYFHTNGPKVPSLPPSDMVTNAVADRFILEVIENEGPIDREVIQKRFANAIGRNRGTKIQAVVNSRLSYLLEDGRIKHGMPDVFSLKGQDVFRVRYPDPDDPLTKRGSEKFPLTELMAAIYNIVSEVGSIDREELSNVLVKNLFGLQRLTIQWRDRIDEVLEALDETWFVIDGAQVRRPVSWTPTSSAPWANWVL